MKDMKETFLNVMKNILDIHEEIDIEKTIEEMGINSISIIQIIVSIEEEFNIEFPDEMLVFNGSMRINQIIQNFERLL